MEDSTVLSVWDETVEEQPEFAPKVWPTSVLPEDLVGWSDRPSQTLSSSPPVSAPSGAWNQGVS